MCVVQVCDCVRYYSLGLSWSLCSLCETNNGARQHTKKKTQRKKHRSSCLAPSLLHSLTDFHSVRDSRQRQGRVSGRAVEGTQTAMSFGRPKARSSSSSCRTFLLSNRLRSSNAFSSLLSFMVRLALVCIGCLKAGSNSSSPVHTHIHGYTVKTAHSPFIVRNNICQCVYVKSEKKKLKRLCFVHVFSPIVRGDGNHLSSGEGEGTNSWRRHTFKNVCTLILERQCAFKFVSVYHKQAKLTTVWGDVPVRRWGRWSDKQVLNVRNWLQYMLKTCTYMCIGTCVLVKCVCVFVCVCGWASCVCVREGEHWGENTKTRERSWVTLYIVHVARVSGR